jgi:hypothetical protein
MTLSPAIHRIEPTPVPALCANVAVQAFRRAVRRTLELSDVDFVTIVTRVLFLAVCHLRSEQQAGDENGKRLAHGDVVGWRRSAISNDALSTVEPHPQQHVERLRKTRIASPPLLEYYPLGGKKKSFENDLWVHTYAFGEVGLVTGFTVVTAVVWTLCRH